MPKRSMSQRAARACTMPPAQQESPKLIGHSEPVFDQLMTLSTVVVTKPSLRTPSMLMDAEMGVPSSFPIEGALLPLVGEADDENGEEDHHRPEAGRSDLAQHD